MADALEEVVKPASEQTQESDSARELARFARQAAQANSSQVASNDEDEADPKDGNGKGKKAKAQDKQEPNDFMKLVMVLLQMVGLLPKEKEEEGKQDVADGKQTPPATATADASGKPTKDVSQLPESALAQARSATQGLRGPDSEVTIAAPNEGLYAGAPAPKTQQTAVGV